MSVETNYQAAELIILRNAFYRTRLHFVFFLWVLSVLGMIVLCSIVFSFIRHPIQPVYFPVDHAGKLIKEVPITQQNLSDLSVTAWVKNAVEVAYSYDFVNYRAQLQNAQQYFFENGWQQYMRGLTQSGNLV